ncbi:MAG: thioredoxin domain-containing protein [Candidatus Caenarcaniphilales bacterium]|nr:thioredoxin domain-containing protein [Candidatus Caenarcaniphilales bacterium]
MPTNHLIDETSPYLRQHAHNPVNWYSWTEEAFDLAKAEDKAVFLSIGYATCHWCHVMAHESFEDHEVADLLNKNFICIKVDREERTDLDAIYMNFVQSISGQRGWPMSVWLTPDKKPFFGGTYFPKETRYGRIGMLELLPRLADLWKKQRDEILRSADAICADLRSVPAQNSEQKISDQVFEIAYQHLSKRFDADNGGFGEKPKFPSPHNLLFLLSCREEGKDSMDMVSQTLTKMRLGGIYDQIGFGFHRYSTDQTWLVPHFEKMLYDQALLIMAYSEAYRHRPDPLFADTVEEIVTYLKRDLKSPEGAFYSAEDADSEGQEGKFYIWSESEIEECLGAEATIAKQVFQTRADGNYLDEVTHQKTGRNILHMKEMPKIASFESLRLDLLRSRSGRIRPLRDEKILTDWNGLVIAALARAGIALNRKDYIELGEGVLQFFLDHTDRKPEKLFHSFCEGKKQKEIFLDDCVGLAFGALSLYEAVFLDEYLHYARELIDFVLKHFHDPEMGGFFLMADFAEKLIARPQELYDGATPSGNSIALYVLLKLWVITGEKRYCEIFNACLNHFAAQINHCPSAYTFALLSARLAKRKLYSIKIEGAEALDWCQALRCLTLSKQVITSCQPDRSKMTQALVCEVGAMCLVPFTRLEDLSEFLQQEAHN